MLIKLTSVSIKDERHLKSFTGVDSNRFAILLAAFSEQYELYQQSRLKVAHQRKRKAGGGRKSVLPSMEDKLVFVLHYYKSYPTFDNLASTFGMSRASACGLLHGLSGVLQKSLEALQVVPKRQLKDTEELLKYLKELGDVNTLLVDATERPYRRLQQGEQRDALFSGKKSDSRSRTPS